MSYEVTIGIPVYNVEKYIRQTMDSALAQTFQSIEFLICDDCGTDSSIAIVQEYQQTHPRGRDIRIVRQSHNMGIGEARNRMMDEAQGRYFYSLDADDMISANAIELLYNAARDHDAELVYGSYERLFVNGDNRRTVQYPYPRRVFTEPDEYAMYAYNVGVQVMNWNYLIRLDIIRSNHLRVTPVGHGYGEDFTFTVDLPTYVTRVVLLPDITYTYYIEEKVFSGKRHKVMKREQMDRSIEAIDRKKRRTELSGKPYYTKRCATLLMYDYSFACQIVARRKETVPPYTNKDIKDIMWTPLSLMQSLTADSSRMQLLSAWLLNRLPARLTADIMSLSARRQQQQATEANEKRKTGVTHIVYIYPELTIKGGADRVIVEKANYLATHGYRVTIVTESQLGREPSFALHPSVELVDIGLDFSRQYHHNFLSRAWIYLFLMCQYRRQLKDVISQLKPDVIISAMGRSIELIGKVKCHCVRMGEAHSIKANVRNLNQMELQGFFYRIVARYMRWHLNRDVKKLDALVLLTREDAAEWHEVRRTFVIPNSTPFLPERHSTLTEKRAIMVARYNEAKGYEYMIEAWSIVHQHHPDWTLHVYGSGELHDKVVRWIQERSLSSTMVLHEPTSNIMERYLESSLCLMSSRYEAFPLVLLEAMACGVPCVSFDCPNGPRNIIRHGEDGLLVDYLNPKALADGICRLIADEPLRRRLGENARRNVQRFSRDAIMQQWEDLFNKLTKELHT